MTKSPERIAGRTPFGLGGRLINIIGLCLLVLGLYAGFAGPVTIGTFTLGPFPFAHFISQSQTEADAYVRANIQISSRPATGWRGGSKTSLECTVQNKGDRGISCIFLRLAADSGKVADIKVSGPFPARQTKTTVFSVPGGVSRSYFQGASVQLSNVSGARF